VQSSTPCRAQKGKYCGEGGERQQTQYPSCGSYPLDKRRFILHLAAMSSVGGVPTTIHKSCRRKPWESRRPQHGHCHGLTVKVSRTSSGFVAVVTWSHSLHS